MYTYIHIFMYIYILLRRNVYIFFVCHHLISKLHDHQIMLATQSVKYEQLRRAFETLNCSACCFLNVLIRFQVQISDFIFSTCIGRQGITDFQQSPFQQDF